MKKIKMLRVMGLLCLFFTMFSCESDLHMYLPEGPQGLSSYDVWVDEVLKGNIEWDKERTDINNYFLYLKGNDGGSGKSAYEIWKEEVLKGLEDPHHPGSNCSKDKTSMQDFWYYLSGAKGQNGTSGTSGKSAYDLWVEEVAKGIDNPHSPGEQWPKDQIEMADFWKFLTGKDGENGAPGAPGSPGTDFTIIKGAPNVIAQYVNYDYSEFVYWVDGSVKYLVYDDLGELAPGAKVRGLPGVQDTNKVYVANADAEIVIPKDDLPRGLDVDQRFGTTLEVEYMNSDGEIVKKASANNTYVPNKVEVKIVISSVELSSTYQINFIRLYRKTDSDANWEGIPGYLGTSYQKLIFYELSDSTDVTSFNKNSSIIHQLSTDILRSYVNTSFYRPTKASKYITSSSNIWDGKNHYYTIVLDSVYGEKPQANAIIRIAPVQYMPFISNIKAYNYDDKLQIFSKITGHFDKVDADIDYNLIFQDNLSKETKEAKDTTYSFFYPVVKDKAMVSAMEAFMISFKVSENTADNAYHKSSLDSTFFKVKTPYINSTVTISNSLSYFRSLPYYSTLKFVKDSAGVSLLKMVPQSSNFPEIVVEQITE